MQIMVIDDDQVSRLAMVDLITDLGITDIKEFPDGKDAWHYLQTEPLPVLVCCDVRMPNMDGIDLLQMIRKNTQLKALPFVLITSGSDKATVHQALKLKVEGYIVKPFNGEEAHKKLDAIFSKKIKKLAEEPSATAQRLSIGDEQLLNYYTAFQDQLDELSGSLYGCSGNEVIAKLDSIQTGCLTLGLWHANTQIERLKSFTNLRNYHESYVEAVKSTVSFQQVQWEKGLVNLCL